MRRLNRSLAPGFTLIELTIVLAVIVTLALILTPSITSFIQDSRIARARTDSQTVASAIVQFYKDTGFFPVTSDSTGGGMGATRVDILISPGTIPTLATTPLGDAAKWTTGTTFGLRDELIANTPSFKLKVAGAQFGWNGPYLTSDIDADPWGNRYMVNVGLIDTTVGAKTGGGATKSAVYVICAGPNGIIETPFTQSITAAGLSGDDIGIRIQ